MSAGNVHFITVHSILSVSTYSTINTSMVKVSLTMQHAQWFGKEKKKNSKHFTKIFEFVLFYWSIKKWGEIIFFFLFFPSLSSVKTSFEQKYVPLQVRWHFDRVHCTVCFPSMQQQSHVQSGYYLITWTPLFLLLSCIRTSKKYVTSVCRTADTEVCVSVRVSK